MTAPSDTKPWLEDESASPHVRALLASARADGPSSADLERLAARLAPVAGVSAAALIAHAAPPPVAPVAPAPFVAGSAASKFAWPALWKVLGAACLVGAGAVAVLPGARRQERPPMAAPASPAVTAKGSQAVTQDAPPAEPTPADLAPSALPVLPAPAASQPSARAAHPIAARPSELSLIQAAQAERDPARTLAILQRHAHAYRDGTFAQEREVLAVSALLALGRRREAEERAARLAQRYPDSAHLRRVRVLLEGPSAR